MFSDASVLRAAEERVRNLVNYDHLTGLPNRVLFHQLTEHALTAARRNNDHGAVLVVNVNRFAAVNDTLGHDVGDELLKQVGQRLRMALRWSDAQKRLSLDRIAVAAPGIGVHRLQATEKLLSYAQELQIRPSLGDIRTTCEQSLPPDLARIASRLIAGHCGLLA